MTGEGLQEAAEAGEKNGPFRDGLEHGGFGPCIFHEGLLALERDLHPLDAREP